MKKSKRYIPLLITLALLSLISLQIFWLFSVYQYKQQEFKDKTREAVLETTKRLQKQEDSKIILKNIDSLIVSDEIIGSNSKEVIRVIVSNIKDKLKTDTFRTTERNRKFRLTGDTSTSTTLIKIGKNKKHQMIVHTESHQTKIKERAGELQALFMKMALNAGDVTAITSPEIDSSNVMLILKDELLKQGIDLLPEVSISYFSKENILHSRDSSVLFKTPGFKLTLPVMITIPLFQDDIIGGGMGMKVGYPSTKSFVIKEMAGLLALSLFITILIGFVIIYIFRRMLSQDKLHQLKNDFINNMTHELKTPIATISLALDGISNPQIKNDEEKFRNYCNILKEENKKLNNHVEHVLQMSLLEQGLIPLNKNPIDIVQVIKSSINTYQLQIQNKKILLNFDFGNEKFILNADEFYLGNAFNNLIDNAVKYSGDFGKIEISLKKIGDEIFISFKDNGIGVEKSLQKKVFEKFFRVQSGNIHNTKGFGLGLSYVKSIVEAHGGAIELKSEINKGSEFIIQLKINEI